MKTLPLFLALILWTAPAFAMGGRGGSAAKCDVAQWTCGNQAFSACAQEMKFFNPEMPTPYGKGGWTINPNSPEFKSCEAQKRTQCLSSKGC